MALALLHFVADFGDLSQVAFASTRFRRLVWLATAAQFQVEGGGNSGKVDAQAAARFSEFEVIDEPLFGDDRFAICIEIMPHPLQLYRNVCPGTFLGSSCINCLMAWPSMSAYTANK